MTITASDDHARRARLHAITVGRLVVAAGLALYLATLGHDLVDPAGRELLAIAAIAHLSLNALVLVTVRPGSLRLATEITTVVDAAAIAIVVAVTGGVASPLAWLFLLEAVAVTLVFGWGGGVRAAVVLALGVLWVNAVPPPALPQAVDATQPLDPSLALALDPTLRTAWLLIGLLGVTGLVGVLSDLAERDLRRWLDDLNMLREVTRELDPRRGMDRVCEALAATMVEQLDYRGAVVWVMRDLRLHAVATAGAAGLGDLELAVPLSPATQPVLYCAETGAPALLRRSDARPETLQRAHGAEAPLVLLPLFADSRLLALISAEVPRPVLRRPSLRGADIRRLQMVAEEAALLLDNARLQSDLRELATTDGLTGLPNHRYLQQRLGEEVARVTRNAEEGELGPLSVALFDLDHFKAINDSYGHPTGDAVLVAVSRAADDLLRSSDVVCRYGGEEFALVLVDTGADEAVRACQRLAERIRSLRLQAEDGRELGTITASFGVATTLGGALDRPQLIAGADRALYAAKRAGRDRVVHLDRLDERGQDEALVVPVPEVETDLRSRGGRR
ncbi:GGDEF domain-containing protein [Egicoccus halophilus]|uniref:GGDEF domain-containing protein n=1 Tax=Egicoccus halophilus TaxID=1670830 RepID=A0A8J3ETQ2_9ACTN|nr:sensor domain-containing diguanylate cyclase [Egicoccus halophilus]GGI06043.1 hypothetical protein GCM10011354_17130 [Egicoccus halophilus]